jgi:anion-transporting  ArsA/GET3 family ATPase
MVLRSEFIARQVLENKVSRAFLHAIPGLEDFAMLGKVWYHTTEQEEGGRARWDLVVLDGPATGHIITMLLVPQAILEAVPAGPLTGPAQATVQLLQDRERTAMAIVTIAEDLPTNEAIELAKKAEQRVGIALAPLVVNALYPPRFAQGVSARALAALPEPLDDPDLQPLCVSARTAQRRRALNEHYLDRLRRDLPLPQVHLPYLFAPEFAAHAIAELSQRIEGQIAALTP